MRSRPLRARVPTTVTASDAAAAAPPSRRARRESRRSVRRGGRARRAQGVEPEPSKPALGVASRDGFALVRPVTAPRIDGWHGSSATRAGRRPLHRQERARQRPGHGSSARPSTSTARPCSTKMGVVAEMIRRRARWPYTDAGLSTAAGIGDYASRGKGTLAKRWEGKPTGLRASRPTAGHSVLAALGGLPAVDQPEPRRARAEGDVPAGEAQRDPRRLVRRSPRREDERQPPRRPLREARGVDGRADVVLALGTSLSGLHADNVAVECARRAVRAREGGLVVVALQRTKRDARASRACARLGGALGAREEARREPRDADARRVRARRAQPGGLVRRRVPARRSDVDARDAFGAAATHQPPGGQAKGQVRARRAKCSARVGFISFRRSLNSG